MSDEITIPSAVPFEIDDIIDLVRLAITWATNQRSINLFLPSLRTIVKWSIDIIRFSIMVFGFSILFYFDHQ